MVAGVRRKNTDKFRKKGSRGQRGKLKYGNEEGYFRFVMFQQRLSRGKKYRREEGEKKGMGQKKSHKGERRRGE